ncbi:MAG: hypothetical protein ACFFAU_00030 [Candidatus Hodarchaeota archaeon]
MVKLFKKKSSHTETFKFETSLKLKSLPLEEYAHVTYAFQVAMLRFERMLKESLLEGYVTSTTLEKISREMNLADIRTTEIPETPSITKLFGTKPPEVIAKEAEPVVTAPEAPLSPVSKPITPKVTTPPSVPPIPPSVPTSISSLSTPSSLPTSTEEPKITHPKISFSIPDAPSKTPSTVPTPKPSPPPTSSPLEAKTLTPPSIPKISFPSISKPDITPPINPLAQPRTKREEDRATGIAILRKQMLTELKKIRSVVSDDQR